MATYLAVTNNGSNKHFSAYTYSDAFQQATDWAGDVMLRSFDEV